MKPRSAPETPRRPLDDGDWNMAYLFPQEVAAARERTGLALLPIAPIEWHGPHLAMGTDNLLAHAFARRLCRELECPYFPPLFVGTERERDPKTLRSIGFEGHERIEGMDFPKNSVGSGYFREEVFAAVVRDALGILLDRMSFRRVLIINGHGALNQKAVLDRLCVEFNDGFEPKRVMWVYPGFPRSDAGAIGHADAGEACLMAAAWPGCVAVSNLPPDGPLKNTDFAVVDSETFGLKPTPGRTVRRKRDPRYHTSAETGERMMKRAAREVLKEVRRIWGV